MVGATFDFSDITLPLDGTTRGRWVSVAVCGHLYAGVVPHKETHKKDQFNCQRDLDAGRLVPLSTSLTSHCFRMALPGPGGSWVSCASRVLIEWLLDPARQEKTQKKTSLTASEFEFLNFLCRFRLF